MTKEEMAQHFAEQKAEELKEMLKDAFLKGYEQGALQTACSISIEGVKYYDLGLPSGTLWSAPIVNKNNEDYYYLIPYHEACKYNGLPTEEQWYELKRFCRVLEDEIASPAGPRLKVGIYDVMWGRVYKHKYKGEQIKGKNTNLLWLKSEFNGIGEAIAGLIEYDTTLDTTRHWAGYKLPIMLTKKKEDIIEK